MPDLTLRLDEGGDVTIDALEGVSWSSIHVEPAFTSFSIGDWVLKASRTQVELLHKGVVVHEFSA